MVVNLNFEKITGRIDAQARNVLVTWDERVFLHPILLPHGAAGLCPFFPNSSITHGGSVFSRFGGSVEDAVLPVDQDALVAAHAAAGFDDVVATVSQFS